MTPYIQPKKFPIKLARLVFIHCFLHNKIFAKVILLNLFRKYYVHKIRFPPFFVKFYEPKCSSFWLFRYFSTLKFFIKICIFILLSIQLKTDFLDAYLHFLIRIMICPYVLSCHVSSSPKDPSWTTDPIPGPWLVKGSAAW